MRASLRAACLGLLGASMATLISCGGGGGASSLTQAPMPMVSLTANPTSVTSGQSSTLTWSSTNATSCTASGAWSGSQTTSGTASTGALTAAATYTLSCTGSGGTSQASASVALTTPTANQVALIVEPGPANRVNTLFTSVTICAPGTSTCQTIDNIQVDTGSSGLRILSSVLSSSITLPAKLASDGNSLVECTKFVDGYSWGPIAAADLTIAGETASNVAVQVIGDPGFSSRVPMACSSAGPAENTVAAFGANGILGISVFAEDCGAACANSVSQGFYYSCTASACSPIIVALASQLPNPVLKFATDNNGVIVQLPSVPAQGQATLAGTLTFGIDTQANNQSGTQKVLTLDSVGNFTAVYNGQSLTQSFFDTGSSGYYFNDSAITPCGTTYAGFYCPNSALTLSATLQGANSVSTTESFSIGNAQTEGNANPTFAVFGNLGGTYPTSAGTSTFDWGLPFYFGKTTYTAFEGKTTSGGTGPYVAF